KGIAQSCRRPKKARALAGHPRDGLLRPGDFRSHAPRSKQRERVPVPLRVILDAVAAAYDLLCETRIARHALADAEKAGPRLEGREHLEHARGDFRIRPIVDGDGDRAARLAARGQTSPV